MSLKSLLMPVVTARMFSRERLLAQRARAERRRLAHGGPHLLRYFHQVDDPYSALVAQCLPRLLARYDIELQPNVVGVPPDNAAPERDKLVAYSRKDAALLARHWGLEFVDPGRQPLDAATDQVRRQLVAAVACGRFAAVAGPLTRALWREPAALDRVELPGGALPPADPATTDTQVAEANALRQGMGHYLGATFFYAGEWYWGLDRLHHLERRLQVVGAGRSGTTDLMFPPATDLDTPTPVADAPVIDFYLSLRSPYTAIITPRVFHLSQLTGAPVRLRYVLPMVMRGLPVPREKRLYIIHDAAREAHLRGIPFGRLNDPLGAPTERGMALIPLAERAGVEQAYLLSFMRGVWSEGIDAGSDRGLRRIAERAGLSWSDALTALEDQTWRAIAEANRNEMFALGLWGVPSLRVGKTAVWGQDRLWAIQQAVLSSPSATAPRKTFATP
jgi:2-hydroxychromene-2-carboxylate isomerase